MKKSSKASKTPSRGRPKQKTTPKTLQPVVQKVGIPAFLEPTEYDMHDELARLDSYAYARHN